MYNLILLLGICSGFASGTKPPSEQAAKLPVTDDKCQRIINCYYTFERDERMERLLGTKRNDVSLCTHLFSGLADIGKDASIQMNYGYAGTDLDDIQNTNEFRNKKRHLKTLIAMQDSIWDNDGRNNKNKILFDPNLRKKLVNNIVKFVEKHKYNGIDLQSQYLTKENAVASEKENFVELLKALKEKFDERGLILSLAVEGIEPIAKKYDIKGISKYVNFINLRTYNLHGDLYKDDKILKAGHLAPLYHSSKENAVDQKLNVDSIVKYWILKGAPPNKLILGTTSKGLAYSLADAKNVSKDAPFVDAVKYRSYTASYNGICLMVKDDGWKELYDKEQQVAYIYKGKDVIGYENVASIKSKAEYAKSMQLAGVFVDGLEDDDSSGDCGGGKYPLLETVNEVFRRKC